MRVTDSLEINFSSRVKIGCPLKKVLLFMLGGFKCGNSKLPILRRFNNLLLYIKKYFYRTAIVCNSGQINRPINKLMLRRA
jgi:hypothetical protein